MAQISRPYQIALLAVLGLAAAWFLLLNHSSGNSSTASSAPSTPAPVKHIARAASPLHATNTASVRPLALAAHKKLHPISKPTHGKVLRSVSAPSVASAHSHARSSTTSTHAQSPDTDRAGSPTASNQSATSDPRALQVERELAQGKTVLLLFWNPKSVDDRAVQRQLRLAAHSLGSRVATHEASASEVDAFGALTERVHVAQTPTILIINREEKVSTLTGFTDAFVIHQAVSEANSKNG